jgi:hypothetical protein
LRRWRSTTRSTNSQIWPSSLDSTSLGGEGMALQHNFNTSEAEWLPQVTQVTESSAVSVERHIDLARHGFRVQHEV